MENQKSLILQGDLNPSIHNQSASLLKEINEPKPVSIIVMKKKVTIDILKMMTQEDLERKSLDVAKTIKEWGKLSITQSYSEYESLVGHCLTLNHYGVPIQLIQNGDVMQLAPSPEYIISCYEEMDSRQIIYIIKRKLDA